MVCRTSFGVHVKTLNSYLSEKSVLDGQFVSSDYITRAPIHAQKGAQVTNCSTQHDCVKPQSLSEAASPSRPTVFTLQMYKKRQRPARSSVVSLVCLVMPLSLRICLSLPNSPPTTPSVSSDVCLPLSVSSWSDDPLPCLCVFISASATFGRGA